MLKAKITVEIEGEENTVASVINDLTLLVKNAGEPICPADFDDDEVKPHYAIIGEELILDPEIIEAWESSTYMNLEEMLQLLESTKVGQEQLLPRSRYRRMEEGRLALPYDMLQALYGLNFL